RDADDLIDRKHEGHAVAGRLEVRCANDLAEDRLDLVRLNERQDDFLLRFDRHAEDLLLLVDPGSAAHEHGAPACTGFDGRLKHAAAPTFANDRDDQRSIDVHDSTSLDRPFKRTIKPSAITETIGASAIRATRPRP